MAQIQSTSYHLNMIFINIYFENTSIPAELTQRAFGVKMTSD